MLRLLWFILRFKITLQGNPIARWHICPGAINGISFSPDGAYLATVGRDGKFLCPRMRIDSFVQKRFSCWKSCILHWNNLILCRLFKSIWLCERTTNIWWEKLLWCIVVLLLEVSCQWHVLLLRLDMVCRLFPQNWSIFACPSLTDMKTGPCIVPLMMYCISCIIVGFLGCICFNLCSPDDWWVICESLYSKPIPIFWSSSHFTLWKFLVLRCLSKLKISIVGQFLHIKLHEHNVWSFRMDSVYSRLGAR